MATLGKAKVWVYLHETGTSRVVYGDPPDFAEMHCWKLLLSPGDTFVDVGANVGVYSVWAASCGASVVAIEPNPHAVARLMANARLNGFRFEVHKKALGASVGRARFSTEGDVLGHLADDGNLEVEVTTLDELIRNRRVRGVKLDVEGYERLVLEGGEKSLAMGLIDILQIEWNAMSHDALNEDRRPIVELLSRHGYRFGRPDAKGRLQSVRASGAADPVDMFAYRAGLW